ncbi:MULTISPECIES: metal-dependent transcriptional regulator [Bacteroidota]|uniref:Transcriptional regulator MntR n=3 Tax=Bacteroidota TaxID=976 RepID=A0A4V6KSR9_9SPHI|nr:MULTISPECIES: metal-dependent transcriptional regulator [Bacteroidota]OJV51135.1 MAG: iron (metal) dependent repressor, dtxr family protein [Bacteroidetes bacterium 43-16]AZA84084.1 metal-dependent transcriptional regulator [Chryseobacterium lactis]AZB04470.1 metal-dependent transcriptional regulator [Chryseobacterium lactis]MBA8986331.1 DtxR family Mn-dependent transcriptional regulator [Sphingobacterium soli]MCT3745515.1 metal-dependent transcriptional regulator [Elizabethkingia anophelis
MISETEENYLKALFVLSIDKGEVNISELSKQLEVKIPTANSMMKRLAEKELVIYESYKPVKLSAKGKKEAALIIRKHRLTEMFLVEKMGFGWEEVHLIAEQIEHIRSTAFFEKMDELLGHPNVDPHGSPIPDINGKITTEHYLRLSDHKKGDKVEFMAVSHSSEDLLKFLNSKELVLGTVLFIESIEPFDGTMSVSYDKRQNEMLSSKVCDKLLVRGAEGNS